MASQLHNTRPADVRQFPAEDPKYLDHVRLHKCARCGTRWRVQAAHTGVKGKGMAIKACDYEAIPLCGPCHNERGDSYHLSAIPESLWMEIAGIKLPELIAALREGFGKPVDDYEYNQEITR